MHYSTNCRRTKPSQGLGEILHNYYLIRYITAPRFQHAIIHGCNNVDRITRRISVNDVRISIKGKSNFTDSIMIIVYGLSRLKMIEFVSSPTL